MESELADFIEHHARTLIDDAIEFPRSVDVGTPLDDRRRQAGTDVRPAPSRWRLGGGSERVTLGLGLFVVSQIARAHEGAVRAESDRGITTFRLLLPRT